MFFREFNFGTRMEHMRLSGRRLLSSLVTHKGRIAAVFWFVGYTAALHPDRLTRGRTEAIQWDSPPWCVMHRSIFFFPQIKWAWASARKKAFGSRLRQAKRSACPTRGWVKFAPPAVRVLEAPMLSVLWGDAEANRDEADDCVCCRLHPPFLYCNIVFSAARQFFIFSVFRI